MKKLNLVACTAICLGLLMVATGCSKDAAIAEKANNKKEVVENQKTTEDLNKEEAENKSEDKDNAANAPAEKNTNGEETNQDKKADEEKSYKVTLTYPSTAYIVDGDEDNKKVTEQVTVAASKEDVVTKVLDQLSQSPKAKDAESVGLDKYDYSKSTLKGTTAVVDLTGDVSGGSLDEDVLTRSIVNSLLSVDGIKAVEFTVNGEKAESLMGRVDISKPFTQNL